VEKHMVEILHNKNLASKFQILAEIANSGPQIRQRDIAKKLEVTPQAISEYIGQLIRDGLVTLEDHSRYKVTHEGVNWMIKVLKDLKDYSDFIVKAVTNISISTAIADSVLMKGQKVGLEMKNGLLAATGDSQSVCTGVAVSDANINEEVGIKDIQGIIGLKAGKVSILKVPNTQMGGSRMIDIEKLRNILKGKQLIGAIGIESLVALRKADALMVHFFGVKDMAVDSAQHGINPFIACVEDEFSGLIKKLEESSITYELVEIKASRTKARK
jgi:putative transcriptional regulator